MTDASAPSAPIVCLQGGGPFVANDDLDRRVLSLASAARGARSVVVLPTADAFEHPERLVAAAHAWGERLHIVVDPQMVLGRAQAHEAGAADAVREAAAVYLVGDQPLHLRSVLKDTAVWDAMVDVLAAGGAVVGCAGSAAGLCDTMVDPRGGAFTLGLGLVDGLALATTAETWSAERLQRTVKLASSGSGTTLVELPTGAALLRSGERWERIGDVVVHGQLP
jgi:cyanophycinase